MPRKQPPPPELLAALRGGADTSAAREIWSDLRQGSCWEAEPDATVCQVRAQLAHGKGDSEETVAQWLRHLLLEDSLLAFASAVKVWREQEDQHTWLQELLDSRGRSLLFFVTSPDACRLLVSGYGLNPAHRADTGSTPYMSSRTAAVARELVALGANPNCVNNGWTNSLFYCSSASVSREMIRLGTNPRHTNHYEHCPLHLSASSGRCAVTFFLLQAGADPTARARDGLTPLALGKKLLGGVPVADGRMSYPTNADDLRRNNELLRLFESCTSFEAFKRKSAQQVVSILAKSPCDALSVSTGLPTEVCDAIFVEYLSIFLFSPREIDDVDTQGRCLVSQRRHIKASTWTVPPPARSARSRRWRRMASLILMSVAPILLAALIALVHHHLIDKIYPFEIP